ncbi:MAG: zf-HC2 domain-containing protein [Deltaproteobacteria bacterium]
MKCHNVQKKLSAYQDKELKPREQEEISTHLLSCQSCREKYEKFEQVWQTLGELEEIHPDPWFYPQLVKKIKEPCEGRPIPLPRWASRLLPVPAIVSILLVIGLLVGIYLGNTLARYDLFPFSHIQTSRSSEETTLTQLPHSVDLF